MAPLKHLISAFLALATIPVALSYPTKNHNVINNSVRFETRGTNHAETTSRFGNGTLNNSGGHDNFNQTTAPGHHLLKRDPPRCFIQRFEGPRDSGWEEYYVSIDRPREWPVMQFAGTALGTPPFNWRLLGWRADPRNEANRNVMYMRVEPNPHSQGMHIDLPRAFPLSWELHFGNPIPTPYVIWDMEGREPYFPDAVPEQWAHQQRGGDDPASGDDDSDEHGLTNGHVNGVGQPGGQTTGGQGGVYRPQRVGGGQGIVPPDVQVANGLSRIQPSPWRSNAQPNNQVNGQANGQGNAQGSGQNNGQATEQETGDRNAPGEGWSRWQNYEGPPNSPEPGDGRAHAQTNGVNGQDNGQGNGGGNGEVNRRAAVPSEDESGGGRSGKQAHPGTGSQRSGGGQATTGQAGNSGESVQETGQARNKVGSNASGSSNQPSANTPDSNQPTRNQPPVRQPQRANTGGSTQGLTEFQRANRQRLGPGYNGLAMNGVSPEYQNSPQASRGGGANQQQRPAGQETEPKTGGDDGGESNKQTTKTGTSNKEGSQQTAGQSGQGDKFHKWYKDKAGQRIGTDSDSDLDSSKGS